MTPGPRDTATALGELGIVASWVLRQAPAAQFAGLGPQMLAAWREQDQQPPAARRQPSRFPPASAALTAALAATAMTVLTGSHEQAIEQIRAALTLRTSRRPRPAGSPAARWRQLSSWPLPVPARPGPRPEPRRPDPLPHRHPPGGHPGRPFPGCLPPAPGAHPAAALAGLGDPADARPRVRARPCPRSAIAACLLLPGRPGRPASTAITALHAYRSALAVGAVLRALAGGGHDTVLTAISCLAG